MGSMLRTRTGLVVVLVVVLAGLFAPSALANSPLTISKTATAHWTRTFEWTIDKSVTPGSHSLKAGQSGTSTYTVAVTKSAGVDAMWVDGQVCVKNEGTVATEGLVIFDRIIVLKSNGNKQVLDKGNLDTSANPVLDPGEGHCYSYSFPFEPFPDAVGYQNEARATITNDPRGPGEPLGPSAEAPFAPPASPTLVNDAVNVDDTNGMSWLFSASGSRTYTRTFTCDRDKGTHVNTATIRQTGQSDSASVTVTCQEKPDCKDHYGKGKDKDDWGKGYGRGNDRDHNDGDRGRGGGDRCDDDDHGGYGDHHDRCDGDRGDYGRGGWR